MSFNLSEETPKTVNEEYKLESQLDEAQLDEAQLNKKLKKQLPNLIKRIVKENDRLQKAGENPYYLNCVINNWVINFFRTDHIYELTFYNELIYKYNSSPLYNKTFKRLQKMVEILNCLDYEHEKFTYIDEMDNACNVIITNAKDCSVHIKFFNLFN